MVPISGRLPEDLYQWLSGLPLEGAATFSDKLREAIATLKRLHDGSSDYVGALAIHRDWTRTARDQLAALEQAEGLHSEVLAAMLEHVPAMGAALQSANLASAVDARALEAQLVRRSLLLAETLLRQLLTSDASAIEPRVVRDSAGRLIELARNLPLT